MKRAIRSTAITMLPERNRRKSWRVKIMNSRLLRRRSEEVTRTEVEAQEEVEVVAVAEEATSREITMNRKIESLSQKRTRKNLSQK